MEQLVASRVVGQDHRRFLAVLLLLAVWLGSQFQARAQQQYNNITGYRCSNSGKMLCNTFALYRANNSYSTVPQIAKLFNTNATVVAKLSKLPPTNQKLDMGKAVIIPITCRCGANSTSFAKISYTIVMGDNLDNVNFNKFESLSTTTEMEAVNSNLNFHDLPIGQKIVFPLRCACPSNSQIAKGVKSLVSYPVAAGDSVDAIASSFGVSSVDVVNGNTGIQNSGSSIYAYTTLVIPINSRQPNYTYTAPPPDAAPSLISTPAASG